MSHKRWLVLLVAAGALFCVSYLYWANKNCPVEQSGPNLNWRLIPDLNKNEEHDRAAYRYGRKRNEGHSVSASLPPSYTLVQQVGAQEDADHTEGKNYVWLTKFACEAKLSDLLVVIFTYGLFLATVWLVWATLKLWKAGDEQLRHLSDTAERQLRAYVFAVVGRVRRFAVNEPVEIVITMKNTGQTPAYQFHYVMNIALSSEPFGAVVHALDFSDPRKATMGPGEISSSFASFDAGFRLSQQQIDLVEAGSAAIWAYGGIRYNDAFGKARSTKFRFIYTGNVVTDPPGIMAHDTEGNEAD